MDLIFRLQRQPPINCPTQSEIQCPVSVLGKKLASPPPALASNDSTCWHDWHVGCHAEPVYPIEAMMSLVLGRLLVLVVVCLACVAPTARAQAVVLASTLGNSDNGWLQLDFRSHWYSQPFQTTGTLFSITSVTLNRANHAGANAILRVYTNRSGHPGSDTGVIFTTPANSDSRVNTPPSPSPRPMRPSSASPPSSSPSIAEKSFSFLVIFRVLSSTFSPATAPHKDYSLTFRLRTTLKSLSLIK